MQKDTLRSRVSHPAILVRALADGRTSRTDSKKITLSYMQNKYELSGAEFIEFDGIWEAGPAHISGSIYLVQILLED
ncbi:MAG: hypothetical protein A2268_05350 [Candidatus Raymondbacteria bacterium RifOxyA12_full_50_37]|uniref:Uncharacterized protein n=1 Tax=Candidatus Raymondbacteria bacterium RIFOXYD12_FULL_49_13 TaxID=1817890 RepID=A0A1F7FC29_UNCRA|nr:MAG: hypothetical protein A2268_05350 [Candidatus Raymondbacteria bacterium RifOxyA12_full_50_37]OGJ88990.1 MAG: hypothetical protein A2248_02585 [Candidatus Raymondbacteria bacterium RIFOXYA2_FULL_49_16]OGJ92499.1 MAG: hypothetical protein A2350_15730 [Candidatus Raymondbacteria bacterium RifOxyB12_full_50_8]OGJ97018.1 MAG: hypothetical protein A2453_04005 [Candidatus Raymondbacteria bacterium RIFOXYC2_FULL_50_21]OGK02562.1 MAG: hypothetical protein A2487_15075 [Candidatus Raymondbacteria b